MAEVTMMVASLGEVRKELDAMRASMVGLSKDSQAYKDIQAQAAATQAKYNEVLKDTKANATAVDGSLQSMRNELAQLKQYANTHLSVDSSEFEEASKKILELNDQIKELEQNQGTYARNVGNYANSFQDAMNKIGMGNTALSKSMGVLQGGITGLKKGFDTIVKHPIILVLGVLVTILKKVYDAMMGNKESADKVKQAFAAFRPILELFNKLFAWLGNILADVALWLAKQLPKALGVFANGMKNGAKVVGFFGQAFGALYGVVGKVIGWIVDKISTFVQWYANVIANILDAVGLDSLAASMRSVTDKAAGYVKVFTDAANNLGNTVKGVFSAIENGMNSAANAVNKLGAAMDKSMKTEKQYQQDQDAIIANREKIANQSLKAEQKHQQAMNATGQERIKLLNEERELLKDNARLQAQNDSIQVNRLQYMTRFSPTSRQDLEDISNARNQALTSQSAYVKQLTKIDKQQIRAEKQMNAATKTSAKEREKNAKDAAQAAAKAEREATQAQKEAIKERKKAYDEEIKIIKESIEREGKYSEERYVKNLDLAKKEYEYKKWYINLLIKDENLKNELLLEASEEYEYRIYETQKKYALLQMELAKQTTELITKSYTKADREFYRGQIESARQQKNITREQIMSFQGLQEDDWEKIMNVPTARKVSEDLSNILLRALEIDDPDSFATTLTKSIPTFVEKIKDIDWNSVINEFEKEIFNGLQVDENGQYNIDEVKQRINDFESKIQGLINPDAVREQIQETIGNFRNETMTLVDGGLITLEEANERIANKEKQLVQEQIYDQKEMLKSLFSGNDSGLVNLLFGGDSPESVERLKTVLDAIFGAIGYKMNLLGADTERIQNTLKANGQTIEGVQATIISNNQIIKRNEDSLDDYNLKLIKTRGELANIKTEWYNILHNTSDGKDRPKDEDALGWTKEYQYALSNMERQNLHYTEMALKEARRRGKLEEETSEEYNLRIYNLEKERYNQSIKLYRQYAQDRANEILQQKGYETKDDGRRDQNTPSDYQRALAERQALSEQFAAAQEELNAQNAEFANLELEQIAELNGEKYLEYQRFLEKRQELFLFYNKALNESEKKVNAEAIKNQKAYLKTYNQFSQAMGNISNILMSYAQQRLEAQVANGAMQQEEAEKEFESYKTFAKATAILDMLGGMAGIYFSTLQDKTIQPSWARIPLAAAQMASAFAQGMMQINQIENTQLGGGTPSASAGGGAATTTNFASVGVNPLLDQTIDENRITQNMTSFNTEESRVYILQSDIEKSNQQVKIRQTNSTF